MRLINTIRFVPARVLVGGFGLIGAILLAAAANAAGWSGGL
jgi:hypothetical protein